MITEKINTKELFASLDETTSTFSQLISSLSEEKINTVPYENSWTAAQVAEHVTMSNESMIQGLSTEGRPTLRDIDAGAPKLKEIFLDFTTKLQSPKFILPTKDTYRKESVVTNFKSTIDRLTDLRNKVDLSETISHHVLGDVTKLEILHFVVYHTQRHVHQLKKIHKTIQQNSNQQQQKQNTMTQSNVTQINPYIGFNGKCSEAMTFYKECLGGELTMQRLGDSPMPCPKGTEDQIMHSSLTRNGTVLLMATDMTGHDGFHQGNNISLSLNCSSEEEINTFFSKLSEGGKVLDTLKDQFWGAIFGMLIDKFGIAWMLNYNKNPQQ
jgi:PhnB protein